jgi:hypothetical protein
MDPNPNHKTQENQTWGSQRGKGIKYVPKPPPMTRSILKKERERKLECIIDLEKPSLAMYFKIEATCALCKATNIFCL